MTRSGSGCPPVYRCSPIISGVRLAGELLERAAVLLVLRDDAAHRVDDLVPAPVSDREVDVQPVVAARPLLGLGQHPGELGGQQVAPADVLHAPVASGRELVGELGDDLDEVGQLLRSRACAGCRWRAGRARRRGCPTSSHHSRNSRIFAAPARWPCAAVRVAELPRPAAVAVDHHRDVAGHVLGREMPPQPVDVEPIEGTASLVRCGSAHVPTLPLRARCGCRAMCPVRACGRRLRSRSEPPLEEPQPPRCPSCR